MLLSILIPTYNYDCSPLLHELKRQIDACTVSAEVIVKDDASNNRQLSEATSKAAAECGFAYTRLPRNVGRAAIRNSLADDAKGSYLLFLDCDAMPANPHVVESFIRCIGQADVVCGSVLPSSQPIATHQALRLMYDRRSAPRFTAAKRQLHPYHNITTFCFMAKAEVFRAVRFDENFRHYGYEDTLFGAALEQVGASILHRDIPIEHRGLESSAIFLQKVKQSNHTLLAHRSSLQRHSALLRWLTRIEALHLSRPLSLLFRCLSPLLERHLSGSRHPSFHLLQLYKLLHLTHHSL